MNDKTLMAPSIDTKKVNGEGYAITHDPIFKKRQMRVVCIGAGVCGIAAAYKYERDLEDTSFIVYEKNAGVGGTWYENTYPGVACDIPAHRYTFSWEGNPTWSRFYAEGNEILQYFKKCAEKWNLMKYIKLEHQVRSAIWNEDTGKWQLQIENLVTGEMISDECDVVLSAIGVLNNWRWPDIPGLHDFKGRKLHSARWDATYKSDGDRIAVIGSGSSAIQIVPQLQKTASKLYSFNRSPNWITPEFGAKLASNGRATVFTPEEIQHFKTDKKAFLAFRKSIINGNDMFKTFYKGSEQQRNAYKNFTQMMRDRLRNDEELCEKLIPKFEVGCKRFTPGEGYLESLIEDNVRVITDGIDCITPTGIRTKSGEEIALDTIVCATGFDVSYRPSFECRGRDGRDLRKEWSAPPRHYMSLAAGGIPNYFIAAGPNCPIANGSLVYALENIVDYTFQCVKKMQTEGIKSMVVKEDVIDEFLEHRDLCMNEMVWSGGCSSWYKKDNQVSGPWWGSIFHFSDSVRVPRYEDYDVRYIGPNRFRYLGYGRTDRELKGQDLATYLSEPDS